MLIARIFSILLAAVFFQNQALAKGLVVQQGQQELVSTLDFVESVETQELKSKVLERINEKEFSEKLVSMGYSLDEVNERVNHLTSAELNELDQSMQTAQAGGILATILIVILIIYFAQRI